MAVLPKILDNLKIKTPAQFHAFLQGGATGPLKRITLDSLEAGLPDCEIKGTEIHQDRVELSNLILDVAQLSLFPKAGIALKNCIFIGKVCINGRKSQGASSVEIDNCIFLDELVVTSFTKMQERNISVFHTNVAYFSLFNIKASELILTGCRVFFLSLHKIETCKWDIDNNEFKHFEMENCKPGEVLFDHKQLDINSIGKRMIHTSSKFELKTYSQLTMDTNLFEFIPYKTSLELQRGESYNTLLETIAFLKNSTTLDSDRNKYTHILFYEVLLAQDKPVNKAFVWITGGFLKPFRFIGMALFILLFFAAFYTLPMLEFNTANGLSSLSFGQALYFSGVTFTTIGYGDVSPTGFSRILAILEGICGISIMSGFLVALVKKYID